MLRYITECPEFSDDGREKASIVARNVAASRDVWSGVIFNDALGRALRPIFRSIGSPRTSTISIETTRRYHQKGLDAAEWKRWILRHR